uniref:Uncharacterized protein n=1 Tax=Nelumbo nucifera TaxID=4432 RepID=A0A822YKM5_NELNU|nr:TPA_asm: hypothetical protein HUJ06_010376 [Nelumbo nucifera]
MICIGLQISSNKNDKHLHIETLNCTKIDIYPVQILVETQVTSYKVRSTLQ